MIANSKFENEYKNTSLASHATGNQIGALVYELYGLTDEEIEIVEGGV